MFSRTCSFVSGFDGYVLHPPIVLYPVLLVLVLAGSVNINQSCLLYVYVSMLQDECKSKYGLPVYYRFLRCFELMPLCAVIENDLGRYFCTHGGISPGLDSLDQIAALDRRWVNGCLDG